MSGGEGVGSGGEGSVTSATSAERNNRPSRERKPVAPWVPYKGKGRNTGLDNGEEDEEEEVEEGEEEDEEEEEEKEKEKEKKKEKEKEKEKVQEPPKKRRGRPPKNLSALQSPPADGLGSVSKRRKTSIDGGAEGSSTGNRSTARRSKMLVPVDRKALFALVSVFVDPAVASTAVGRSVRSSVSAAMPLSAGAVDWIQLVPTEGGKRQLVESLRAILLYDA